MWGVDRPCRGIVKRGGSALPRQHTGPGQGISWLSELTIEHVFDTMTLMIQRTIEHTKGLDDVALDARIRDLELQQRRIEAEQAVAVAEAERRGLHTADGHTSMKTYLRATCNLSSGRPPAGAAWRS